MKDLDKGRLLREVREQGVEIDSINDLMKIDAKYKDLVPILLKYLQEFDDETDKEFIVRCLGVKGFKMASKPLIQEFYRSDNSLYKWAIGNTLSIIQDENSLPDLLRIVQEKQHGIARQMIVDGLGCFKSEAVKDVLIKLLDDDDVVGHAISAIRKMNEPDLIKHIEPFTDHKVTWIRNEAKKAIKKLQKTQLKGSTT